jgi:hypothetical protein
VDAARCAGRTVVESQSGFDLRGAGERVVFSLSIHGCPTMGAALAAALSHEPRGGLRDSWVGLYRQ